LASNVSDAYINRDKNPDRKGLTDVSQILTRSERDMWVFCANDIVSISSAV